MAGIRAETFEGRKDGASVPFAPEPVERRRRFTFVPGTIRITADGSQVVEIGDGYADIQLMWVLVSSLLNELYVEGRSEACGAVPELPSVELRLKRVRGQSECTAVSLPRRSQLKAIVLGRVCAEERELVQAILAEARRVSVTLDARFPNGHVRVDSEHAGYDRLAAAMERTLAQARPAEGGTGERQRTKARRSTTSPAHDLASPEAMSRGNLDREKPRVTGYGRGSG